MIEFFERIELQGAERIAQDGRGELVGGLEDWSDGVMENWGFGVMQCWNNGVLG